MCRTWVARKMLIVKWICTILVVDLICTEADARHGSPTRDATLRLPAVPVWQSSGEKSAALTELGHPLKPIDRHTAERRHRSVALGNVDQPICYGGFG